MKLLSLQFSLFFNDIIVRPDKSFSDFSEKFPEFDSMPTILPIPEQAPVEIPVILHNSLDGRYSCQISRSRINILIQSTADDANGIAISKFLNIYNRFNQYVLSKERINRFGLVGNYFYVSDNPIHILMNKYFKDTISGTDEINLRFNKKRNSFNLELNDVVSFSVGYLSLHGDVEKEGIIIQRDINSDSRGVDDFNNVNNILEDIIKSNIKFMEEECIKGLIL